MLPSVRAVSSDDPCDFVWLMAESYGPVDGSCGAEAEVALAFHENHAGEPIQELVQNRCLTHAADEMAEAVCRELGTPHTEIPAKTFEELGNFFESWIRFSLQRLQSSSVS